jgi:hypothetical protein
LPPPKDDFVLRDRKASQVIEVFEEQARRARAGAD